MLDRQRLKAYAGFNETMDEMDCSPAMRCALGDLRECAAARSFGRHINLLNLAGAGRAG